ncbi:MAG: hypothetical protein K2X82_10525 [Gemmataceae bacterium]|nr:hypothetical protein [Gemmataceae bacterium]
MRRTLAAALLAAPLWLGFAAPAGANDGPCTFGLGCGGHCLKWFPRIHQHGPLFNYGPYYGYPPFEPYGPWDAYMRYTGPDPSAAGQGAYGWIHGWQPGAKVHNLADQFHNRERAGLFHHGDKGCSACGGGLFHHGRKGGCNSCGAAAASHLCSGNALDRYTGFGTPAGAMAFYADTPLPARPAGVVPAGFFGN